MSTFVFDCPNCAAKNSTFDVEGFSPQPIFPQFLKWSLFSVCRSCKVSCNISTVLDGKVASHLQSTHRNIPAIQGAINKHLQSDEGVSFFNSFTYSPILPNTVVSPEYIPAEIEAIFNEAAKCLSIGCYNAAGAMFRLCLDITTKYLIEQNKHLNPSSNDNRSIHSRLTWIFNNNVLPRGLEDLSRCIKDDGNDAAHDGNLGNIEAEDLLDFTNALLEQVYTQPEKVRIARERRQERRNS